MTELPAACALLVRELQELRSRRDLSLATLADRTPFSKSSWSRYLNGKALPPLPAVQALCRLTDEPEARLQALWTVAEAAWSRRDAVAVAADSPGMGAPFASATAPVSSTRPGSVSVPEPDSASASDVATAGAAEAATMARSRHSWWALVAAFAACVLLGAGITAFAVRGSPQSPTSAPSTAAGKPGEPIPVGCVGRACDGGDPTAMDCGIAPQSLGTFHLNSGADLEFRYNAQCQAAWVRTWNSAAGDRLSISAGSDRKSVVVPDVYAAQTFYYTPMVPALAGGPELKACLTDAPSGYQECVSVPQPLRVF